MASDVTMLILLSILTLACCLPYEPELEQFNLNQNQLAKSPLEYSGSWPRHTYHPSPKNWRFPFYTLFLDRFINGDPTNDNANGTAFEQDPMSNQLRHGGDLQGLMDGLDYLQGMGVKGIYIAGSPFINQPYGVDSYSPLDLTLLDFHYGDVAKWRDAIGEVHKRGMYVILDHTMATLGDLLGFEGFLNASTPFKKDEYSVVWKSSRRYHDFHISESNEYNDTCKFPKFWDEAGFPVVPDLGPGCYNSDFDQFGDTEAFGVYPDWRRSLTKFASVQDRLREWEPSVLERLEVFSCLTISMLDPDGFRFDKALQTTIEPFADFAEAMRRCARKYGKDNFFMPGEVTGGNTIGSIYFGRGRQPDQKPPSLSVALQLNGSSDDEYFLRDKGKNAIDSGAFSYSIYRSLTRFLGLDGNLEAGFDLPVDWVDAWNEMLMTNDMVNAETGELDPRHMYGSGNQDVFRWPAIRQGIERNLLALYIVSLHLPGMPILWGGEEQSLFALDSTAANYIFGRQPLTSAPGWQLHACYSLGTTQYNDWPVEAALTGCDDETVGYDHRDPSHPVRNVIKSMFHMRDSYRALVDGFLLQPLSKQTEKVKLPGSFGRDSEFGLWSVARGFQHETQADLGASNTFVWLVYQNRNTTTAYEFDCSGDTALISPFPEGSRLKNLFHPYDELTLEGSQKKLGFDLSDTWNGCYPKMTMEPFEFRAYVRVEDFVEPPPMITRFTPGHDSRLPSSSTVDVVLEFSTEMDCSSVGESMTISGVSEGEQTAAVDSDTVTCESIATGERYQPPYSGAIGSVWRWSATLTGVRDGIVQITLDDPQSSSGASTGAVDHLFFRIGKSNNPVVFPSRANYSSSILSREGDDLVIEHSAAGASMWRYSLNWGSSWSEWKDYIGGRERLASQPWSGTKHQEWEGDHVIAQYWSKPLGTSSIVQHGDASYSSKLSRRFPHLFAHGTFNQFGFDSGIANEMRLTGDGIWELNFMAEWPSRFKLNVWGINPDEQPDATYVLGDVDGNGILDRTSPGNLAPNFVNFTGPPPSPYLAYRVVMNDGNWKYELQPVGNRLVQMLLFILLATVPIVAGMGAVIIFMRSFYDVKVVEVGAKQGEQAQAWLLALLKKKDSHANLRSSDVGAKAIVSDEQTAVVGHKRRTVLIATIEYNIDDWGIKIKIGGLGVMAALMGTALEHMNLVWVVPCVGGIDYPVDQPAEPMYLTIMGNEYEVQVQYHHVKNITYVLLDAPIFRQQTKSDPYPGRMDDLESGIYYSAWNQAVGETMRRFNVDLYHINDYHAAAAPLYLLPNTVPCCLSLHNAEFQGMWPMRTPEEAKEVCDVFNLSEEVMKEYFQFGTVANLLHAGVSYLKIHQHGFGAVGVSTKYGERSYARYPIFWGLKDIGSLPNPDPSDTEAWDPSHTIKDVTTDQEAENGRGDLRRQAQEWAGLNIDQNANLFVFVGRWSLQKGVDLIADVFPAILEKHPSTQLICIGPVIDLYGKFAALKLSKLVAMYPGRVFSKPEFTQLPPCIFSGAEFALIPSRDEPFGLVAVEFGRKGALGVGAKVGGLGQMPGFWYTVESTSTKHLLRQFKGAITEALESKQDTRRKMRAWSAKQRFPVAQWLQQLEDLQSKSIRKHERHRDRRIKRLSSAYPFSKRSTRQADSVDSLEPTPPLPSLLSVDGQSLTPTGDSSRARPFLSPRDIPPVPLSPFQHERHTSATSQRTSISIDPSDQDELPPSRPPNSPVGLELGLSLASAPGTPPPGSETQRGRGLYRQSIVSTLSVNEVVGDRDDFNLQKVDPFFNDTTGDYYRAFDRLLTEKLTYKNSDTELCIEEFLMSGEKEWFARFRDAKLGRSRSASRSPLIGHSRASSPRPSSAPGSAPSSRPVTLRKKRVASNILSIADRNARREGEAAADESDAHHTQASVVDDEFLLGNKYTPPTGLKKMLQIRLGDWPVYSLLLALGQIISANSYQIVLITGEIGQRATKLYIIAGTYLVTSVGWWLMMRRFQARYALSVPWLFYSLAFFLLGVSPFVPTFTGRGQIQTAASALYAAAASSGAMFFSLNFGDEGNVPTSTFFFRACIIEGVKQVYIIALWFWGGVIASTTAEGFDAPSILSKTTKAVAVCIPIAAVLATVGVVLFMGLPQFYRQTPDTIPSFYKSLLRRRVVPWFLFAVVIQNYFLSTLYGRNWAFLFSSQHVPQWAILLLALGFLVLLWAVVLYAFAQISKSHPWLIPIFAVGLLAPRWAQMLWGTSNIGLYLPWAGGPTAQALASRSLWLWLGLLDAVQGLGIGMMLLLTLTRIHVAAAVIGSQVLGSAVTILARATAPHRVGPADVFPDFSTGIWTGISKPWFWVGLLLQLLACVGFFKFFRKEQTAKP